MGVGSSGKTRPVPDPTDPRIVLVRHGSTPWSDSGRHTGRTDIQLTEEGEAQAERLAPALAGRPFALVLSSPLSRALETARRAGFGDRVEQCDDLVEWDYGEYEGLTTTQIRERMPEWTVWTHPCPGGETAAQVAARADTVLARARAAGGDVLLVAHGHLLRVLVARWLWLGPADGRLFRLDPATVSELGYERTQPALVTWNAAVASSPS